MGDICRPDSRLGQFADTKNPYTQAKCKQPPAHPATVCTYRMLFAQTLALFSILKQRTAARPLASAPSFAHPVLQRLRRSLAPRPQWRYALALRSDPGQVRTNNEDAVRAETTPPWTVAVLADGMGGYSAGEVASALAVECITRSLAQSARQRAVQASPARTNTVHKALARSLQEANATICAHASAHSHCRNMGTTVVAAVFTHDKLVVAHLGDSRAYLWRCGTLRQLTHDHSWLQEQIDSGRLSDEAAARSTRGHLITRALGVAPQARPTLREVRLEAGDRVLLCSDGLSDLVSASAIAALLATHQPLETQAQRLIDKANAQGGRDNISVILVEVQSTP